MMDFLDDLAWWLGLDELADLLFPLDLDDDSQDIYSDYE
jgi:hypothetical protein